MTNIDLELYALAGVIPKKSLMHAEVIGRHFNWYSQFMLITCVSLIPMNIVKIKLFSWMKEIEGSDGISPLSH